MIRSRALLSPATALAATAALVLIPSEASHPPATAPTVALAAAAAGASPPATYRFDIRKKERYCAQNGAAVLDVRPSETRVTQHGSGKTYYLKGTFTWQTMIGTDRWRTDDHVSRESGHFEITNPRYQLYLRLADRTVWGGEYQRRWQALVTIELKRERRGPDATVWKDERTFSRAQFREAAPC